MSEQIDVKVAKATPSGATAVAVTACSDRLSRVPGIRKAALDRCGFTGAIGASAVFDDGDRATVVVGLGASDLAGTALTDALRRAAAAFVRAVPKHRRAAFEMPEGTAVDPIDAAQAVTEGLVLGAYRFDDLRSPDKVEPGIVAVTLVVGDDNVAVRSARAGVVRGAAVAGAVCFARDLVNTPGGTLTAPEFADRAAARAAGAGLAAEILDLDAITEARLGGLVAVNQGSAIEPRLVKLTYEPDGADADTPTVALVGKGITFDSGGLSIKPAAAMMDMKDDMGGAAAVIAAMCALPALGVAVRAVSFTPMTDNMIGGAAQRPGDVYTARNGTTVEVLNTDAEGRLVLGEALALASEEEPAAIVDLATLTGACLVALGDRIAGLMSNDDDFRGRVADAAAMAGERVWPLPLPDDYRSRLDSQVADIKNISSQPWGGTLTAGLFLREFVADGIPWAHIDIAGPAYLQEPDGEHSKGATGFGVRTLLTLLEGWEVGSPESTEPEPSAN
ncbi:MAG: leucyl aminopeptidase [Actinobacteria bacterium]|nr:leucyl aminopeptidase [Actinomycetota bacterium]